MRRRRNAKILATLGPATSSQAQIRALFEAGADAFRLNFSHGSHADQKARYQAVRAVEAETQRPVAVVIDLQGPKLRVGSFGDGAIELARGARFRLDLAREPGDQQRVSLPHPEIFRAIGGRHRAAARRRQDPAPGRAGRAGLRRDRGCRAAAACPTARASTCRTSSCRCRP